MRPKGGWSSSGTQNMQSSTGQYSTHAGDPAQPGADRFLAELGAHLIADDMPLAGGALTLAVPHPIIARRTWLWRAGNGEVIEAVGFAPAGFGGAGDSAGDAGRRWLAGIARGAVHEDAVGRGPDGPVLGWIGPRPFTESESRSIARGRPLCRSAARRALGARDLVAALEAYLGRRSAARVLAGPLRREVGETIRAALLYADLRGFTALSESASARRGHRRARRLVRPHRRRRPRLRRRGAEIHRRRRAGDLSGRRRTPRNACDAALRAVASARAGMAHLDEARRAQGLPPLPFGVALHLGEMLWGNIGAADRLDFTAIGPAVNLVSRLEGLCRPLGRRCWSRARSPPRPRATDPAGNARLARHRRALRRLHGRLARIRKPSRKR